MAGAGVTRVAIFTDNDFDKTTGVATTLKAVLRFGGDAIERRIYTAADVGVETAEYYAAASMGIGVPWYRDMRVYWPRVRAFARELQRQQVDVLHVTTPGPVGLAARWLATRLRLPLVGSYHTQLSDYPTLLGGSPRIGDLVERYVRWFYGSCDPLFVPSTATSELLAAQGYGTNRVRVWGRGVDVEQFAPRRASAAWRDQWHVDGRRPAILYAGRLSREKGLALVGPIRRTLLRHGLEHQFIFAGDGPMRAELEAMCPDGLFLGALRHDMVAVAMASADIFLFPSAIDTLGNVVLEAQAAGLPVVVSDRGGPREHLLPSLTGLACAADRADAFAGALVTLLTRPHQRVSMGRHARRYAESRDWPKTLAPLFAGWRDAADRPVDRHRGRPQRGLSSPVFNEETVR